jgi:hypothetical protein
MLRTRFACCVLCVLSACDLLGPRSTPSIAGTYQLTSVDGQSLPCCTRTDTTTGVSTTPLGDQLTLEAAPPESYVASPAGMKPASCVHEVPSGSRVDADTVFRPDGSWYLLPPCGRGSYAMTLTERVDSAGVTQTATVSYTGRYSWDTRGIIEAENLSGSFVRGANGVDVTLQDAHLFATRDYPTCEFTPRP